MQTFSNPRQGPSRNSLDLTLGRRPLARRDGAAMRAAISDGFLNALTAAGDESAVRAGVRRYVEAGVTLPCVGPIPKTDFEATLRAAAL